MTTVTRLARVFLIVGAAQGYAIGLTGLARPASIVGFPLATTPLNDRFVASFYVAGAIGLTLTALAPRATDMLVLLSAFSVVTLLLLAVTVGYWSDFTADGVPYPWLVSYIVDPVVGGALILALRPWPRTMSAQRGVRLVLLCEAAVFCALGLMLVAAPGAAIDVWPWHLTAILARVYGMIFLGLALAALLAANESRAAALVPFLATSLVFAVGGLAVYGIHRSRFDGSIATGVWLAAHIVGTIAFAVTLLAVARGPTHAHADVAALAEP